VPTLLFLFHRCRAWPGLSTGCRQWAPFRLQFYCNGHSWLARQLTAEGIGFTAADNAFIRIDDWQRAQDLGRPVCRPTGWHPGCLTAAPVLGPAKRPDPWAAQCCPVLDIFRQSYHWSLMQVEYATDLVVPLSRDASGPLYQHLARESVLSVKAEQIASFLGRQISPQLAQEIGSQFFPLASRGPASNTASPVPRSRLYGQVRLRAPGIETTINNVSFFQAPPQEPGPRPFRVLSLKIGVTVARLWQAVSFLKERLFASTVAARPGSP